MQVSARTDCQLLPAHTRSARYILVSIVALTPTPHEVGDDRDQRLPGGIAHEDGGNFDLVRMAAQNPDVPTGEVGEALGVVRQNAALTIALPTGAVVTLLNRYHSVHNDQALRVHLEDMTPGQHLQLVLRVQFPTGIALSHTSVVISLFGNGDELQSECEITWRYIAQADSDFPTSERDVERGVAQLYSAHARVDATETHRSATMVICTT